MRARWHCGGASLRLVALAVVVLAAWQCAGHDAAAACPGAFEGSSGTGESCGGTAAGAATGRLEREGPRWPGVQAGALLALYLVVYVLGRSANRALASRWVEVMLPVFREQFHSVGVRLREEVGADEAARPIESGLLECNGAQSFYFYASGRRHCEGILVELDLKPRHDLLSLLYSLFYTWEDTIMIDVPLDESAVPRFVFTVARQADLAFTRKTMRDVAAYTRQVPLELLPRSLACLTDCSELVTQLLTPDVVRLLAHLEAAGHAQGEGSAAARSGVVQLIHVSDQNTNSGFGPNDVPERALRFRFHMPSDLEDSACLLALVFALLDLVSAAVLSPSAVQAAEEARKRQRRRARPVAGSPSSTSVRRARKAAETTLSEPAPVEPAAPHAQTPTEDQGS
jgi:hypothetical protein